MEIDRSQYTQVHLEELQKAFNQHNWFTLLDSPNRVMTLVRNCHPPRIDDPESIEGKKASWDMPASIVCSKFYGLWPNPTESEKFVAQLLYAMVSRWMGLGCMFEPDSDAALTLLDFHFRLSAYISVDELIEDVLKLLPEISYPLSNHQLDLLIAKLGEPDT